MAIVAVRAEGSYDLRALRGRSRIGIFTGAFDPAHAGHVEAATIAREYSSGTCAPVDTVLFQPNPYPEGKSAAPLGSRVRILEELVLQSEAMGILSWGEAPHDINLLFEGLRAYAPGLDYVRIIGEDVALRAAARAPHIPTLVIARGGNAGYALPEAFSFVSCTRKVEVSSTDLREGKVPLGPEYAGVKGLVAAHYPRSLILPYGSGAGRADAQSHVQP